MAGAGFKDFAVGEVLTASDVDTYLMQQSVMRFADAAARGSALGTAVGAGTALAEGMVSYLDDANTFEIYNGTVWVPPVAGIGSNVVQSVKSDTFATTATGTWQDIGLSATITPTLSSSKILVICYVPIGVSGTNGQMAAIQLLRGSTAIFVGDASSSRLRAAGGQRGNESGNSINAERGLSEFGPRYVDSPATTSSVTYKLQLQVNDGIAYVNRTGNDIDSARGLRTASSIILIEVAA